jgi:hypothetical protein
MAGQMDEELQRNLLHVFKIPGVFISSIFLACSLAYPSLNTAVTSVLLGVYLKTLSCLLNGPSLAHYSSHRCLASLLETVAAFLHLQLLPSICNCSPGQLSCIYHHFTQPEVIQPQSVIAPLNL